MNDNRLVTEEVRRARRGGEKHVRVADRPSLSGDVAMLAGQIARLARLRYFGLAGMELAALRRVEMGDGGSAVAVGWDGEFVDVVD